MKTTDFIKGTTFLSSELCTRKVIIGKLKSGNKNTYLLKNFIPVDSRNVRNISHWSYSIHFDDKILIVYFYDHLSYFLLCLGDENSKINWTFDQTYNSFDAVESTEKNLFENPVTRNFLEDLGCVEGGMFIRRVLKHGGDPMDKLFEVYCSGKVSYLRVYGQPVMVLKYHVDVSDKMPTQPFWKNIKSQLKSPEIYFLHFFGTDLVTFLPASQNLDKKKRVSGNILIIFLVSFPFVPPSLVGAFYLHPQTHVPYFYI